MIILNDHEAGPESLKIAKATIITTFIGTITTITIVVFRMLSVAPVLLTGPKLNIRRSDGASKRTVC